MLLKILFISLALIGLIFLVTGHWESLKIHILVILSTVLGCILGYFLRRRK
jgi:uncharacterized membrane protein